MTARVQVKMNVSWAWPIDVTPAAAEPHLGLYSPSRGSVVHVDPAQPKPRTDGKCKQLHLAKEEPL